MKIDEILCERRQLLWCRFYFRADKTDAKKFCPEFHKTIFILFADDKKNALYDQNLEFCNYWVLSLSLKLLQWGFQIAEGNFSDRRNQMKICIMESNERKKKEYEIKFEKRKREIKYLKTKYTNLKYGIFLYRLKLKYFIYIYIYT